MNIRSNVSKEYKISALNQTLGPVETFFSVTVAPGDVL